MVREEEIMIGKWKPRRTGGYDPGPPKDLEKIVDKVLSYRPKPKSKAAKKRKRLAAKHA